MQSHKSKRVKHSNRQSKTRKKIKQTRTKKRVFSTKDFNDGDGMLVSVW